MQTHAKIKAIRLLTFLCFLHFSGIHNGCASFGPIAPSRSVAQVSALAARFQGALSVRRLIGGVNRSRERFARFVLSLRGELRWSAWACANGMRSAAAYRHGFT